MCIVVVDEYTRKGVEWVTIVDPGSIQQAQLDRRPRDGGTGKASDQESRQSRCNNACRKIIPPSSPRARLNAKGRVCLARCLPRYLEICVNISQSALSSELYWHHQSKKTLPMKLAADLTETLKILLIHAKLYWFLERGSGYFFCVYVKKRHFLQTSIRLLEDYLRRHFMA